MAGFEDGRVQKPSKAGRLQKLKKTGKWILPQKGMQPSQHLGFSPGRWISGFCPPRLWSFAIDVIAN